MRRWPLLAGLLLLVVIVASVTVAIRRGTMPKPLPLPVKPPPPLEVTVSGIIEATKILEIPAPTAGLLDKLLVKDGEEVFSGELLARIRNPKIEAGANSAESDAERAQNRASGAQASLTSARLDASRLRAEATSTKGELEALQKEYQRQKMLYAEGATPRLVFEKAESEYNRLKTIADGLEKAASEAEQKIASLTQEVEAAKKDAVNRSQHLDEARAEMGVGEVHSPADGILLSHRVEAGEEVKPDMKDFLRLAVDLETLQVKAIPDSTALARIKPGAATSVITPEAPGSVVGTVRSIGGQAVLVEFKRPLPAVKPGQAAQVKIALAK